MAPSRETLVNNSYTKSSINNSHLQKPPRLSMETLQRTISDISFELTKESSITSDAKCECCGMCEECTPEYISRIRSKFSGKLMCGLCQEAVKEEMEKNGGKREEALSAHMSACVRFNRFGRTHPVLFQAEAMKEILHRAKSLSPGDRNKGSCGGGNNQTKGGGGGGGIRRSTSCIQAIDREGD